MGLFDLFKSRKKGIDEPTFYSKQFRNEILAFAQAKYLDHRQNYEAVNEELEKQGLNNEQCLIIIELLRKENLNIENISHHGMDSTKSIQLKNGRNNKSTKSIANSTFISKQFRNEILALTLVTYERHNKNYDAVYEELEKVGLNNEQCLEIIDIFKQLILKIENESPS